MRKMQNKHGDILNIVDWWMTVNMWEYYITDKEEDEDIVFAMVCGDFDEMGDISRKEIRPYIKTRTQDLNEIQPAPGWKWVS